jgi:hypothetical protein
MGVEVAAEMMAAEHRGNWRLRLQVVAVEEVAAAAERRGNEPPRLSSAAAAAEVVVATRVGAVVHLFRAPPRPRGPGFRRPDRSACPG